MLEPLIRWAIYSPNFNLYMNSRCWIASRAVSLLQVKYVYVRIVTAVNVDMDKLGRAEVYFDLA